METNIYKERRRAMTVQELINELNFSGDVLLKHRDTDEEKRKKAEETERFNREWEEEMERGRDMPTFASRW